MIEIPTIRRSGPAFVGMMGPYIVWAAHFVAIYGVNGLFCARPWMRGDIAGLPLAPTVVVALTVAALALLGWIMAAALRGPGPAEGASPEARRFVRAFTLLSTGAAFVGVLWDGLPALQVPPCA